MDTLLGPLDTEADYALVRSYGGYTTNLPLEDLLDGKAWVVFELRGRDSRPSTAVPPGSWFPTCTCGSRRSGSTPSSCWTDDEPGFWESLGYHEYGDPWREQRYAGD